MDAVSAIAEVELEIKIAESKAVAADTDGKPETASYWRTKEQQLREKGRQLREKELLILRASGLQALSPAHLTSDACFSASQNLKPSSCSLFLQEDRCCC